MGSKLETHLLWIVWGIDEIVFIMAEPKNYILADFDIYHRLKSRQATYYALFFSDQ